MSRPEGATPVVVVGAGGFGRETLDVVEAMNEAGTGDFELLGVLDDSPSPDNLVRLADRGCPYLGSVADWLVGGTAAQYLIGVGSPGTRAQIARQFDDRQAVAATAIHPSVTFGPRVALGGGAVICAGVRITNNIRIGRHAHLNLNVTVGHDTTIGDFVSINPLVAISGDCVIADRVMFGTGSVILQGLHVGADAIVGASACVVRDVAAGLTVKGIPAR